jgi:hypothetical protein
MWEPRRHTTIWASTACCIDSLYSIYTNEPCGSKELVGRAIAEAAIRWLPTEAARVRAQVWSSGICGGQSGAGSDFLRVLRFPLPNFSPPNSPSSESPGAGTIGQKWPTCRVDPVWTPHPLREFKKNCVLTMDLSSQCLVSFTISN